MRSRIRAFSFAASLAVSSILGGSAAVLVPGAATAASCSPSAAFSHTNYAANFWASSTCTGTNLQSTTVFVYGQHCDTEGPFGICIVWATKYSWQKTCNYVSGNNLICTKSVNQTVSLSGLWHTYMTSTTQLTSGGPITNNTTTDQYQVP